MPTEDHEITGFDVVLASGARTVSGVGTDVFGFENARALQFILDITAFSGTTPTLDVEVQVRIKNLYTRLVTFTQRVATGTLLRECKRTFTAAPAQLVLEADPGLTAAGVSDVEFSDTLRVKYTIGGTTPSFTFSVVAFIIR